MTNTRQLGNGIELVKSDIFWPESQWYFMRGEMMWSRIWGWQKYYEANRADSYLKSADAAMAAWNNWEHRAVGSSAGRYLAATRDRDRSGAKSRWFAMNEWPGIQANQ